MLRFFGLVLLCLCSISSSKAFNIEERIIGGNFSDINQFRSHVAVLNNNYMYCGGSLIKWNWVLTAGHCTYQVTAAQLSVRAGSTEWSSGGVLVYVNSIVRNPSFDYNTLTHDISLLKLSASLLSYSYNYPINIIGISSTQAPTNADVILPGWGLTQVDATTPPTELRSAYLQKIDETVCQSQYGSLDSTMICAGVWSGGVGACHGDSGGGLRYNGYLIGTVSYGHICAEAFYPTVFSNVVYLKNWITNNAV